MGEGEGGTRVGDEQIGLSSDGDGKVMSYWAEGVIGPNLDSILRNPKKFGLKFWVVLGLPDYPMGHPVVQKMFHAYLWQRERVRRP